MSKSSPTSEPAPDRALYCAGVAYTLDREIVGGPRLDEIEAGAVRVDLDAVARLLGGGRREQPREQRVDEFRRANLGGHQVVEPHHLADPELRGRHEQLTVGGVPDVGP